MDIKPSYRPCPVSLQIFGLIELLALDDFKGCPTDKDLEESYAERPDVRLASVVNVASSAFR